MNKLFCDKCGKRNVNNSRFCEGCDGHLGQGNPVSLFDQPVISAELVTEPAGAMSNELFNSVVEESVKAEGYAKTNNIIVSICCVLSIFFGGLIPLVVAGITYLPFRDRWGGWLFFVFSYIITTILLVIILLN